MLLDRAEDSEKAPTVTAHKIGMCNVPPYIFAQTVKSGTIYVGNDSEYRVTRHQVEFIILWKWWLLIILQIPGWYTIALLAIFLICWLSYCLLSSKIVFVSITQGVITNQVQQAAGHMPNRGNPYSEEYLRNMFSEL
jgi:hypothetical protein